MIDFIYIILFISTCCFSASLLARVITNKTGNTKNDQTIGRYMGFSFVFLLTSLLAILLNTCGLLENKWSQAGGILGGMGLTTIAALAMEKYEDLNKLQCRLFEGVGLTGAFMFFFGVELLVANIFAESVRSGIVFCLIIAFWAGLLTWVNRARNAEQEAKAAEKQAVEQLEARVLASIAETGKAPDDIPKEKLDAILHRLAKKQAEVIPEDERRAAYEKFLLQHLPEREHPTDNIQE